MDRIEKNHDLTQFGEIIEGGRREELERDDLIAIPIEGSQDMPGCLSYIVTKDSTNPEAVWVTEVWESQVSHQASLSLPAVQQAIGRGKPLIAGFGERFETIPVGGHGLGA
jgi:quinol monooxygenase YgiN